MFAFWKEAVPDKVIKGCPADVQVLASLVFAHPVVSDFRQHTDKLLTLFLSDVAVTSVYIIENLLKQFSYDA